ncbi:MAG TPA: 3-phosphoshikimate 1-carboxyvinyltransferase [Candidatus Saccharimonadia bacterium]|nr:3-phosphoshikimate 1-carboxyvinyltransferase [Candidatus Saccharimonadia bacterium]
MTRDETGATLDWISRAGRATIAGTLRVPGDKSISHRAIMLGAIASGTTEVSGFLEGEDTRATAAAFSRMGVRIDAPAEGVRVVHGSGGELSPPPAPLDLGNSGTAMRLMAGLLCAQPFASELVGDASLSRRPMRRVIEPLLAMGARIDAREGGVAPLRISPVASLRAIDYRTPVASAQVKSAVLLAGLRAHGTTRVAEPHPTRDHTERMLAAFGARCARDGEWVAVDGGAALRATPVAVPGDISSAAFFVVAATLVPGSELVVEDVGLNPLRIGIVHALRAMGADLAVERESRRGDEPYGNLRVRGAALRGIDVPPALVPDMIDEFPILYVAAALARGTTVVRGAAELRVKESDRIAVMARGLRALGAHIEETADGAVIEGVESLAGGAVDSAGDHRCAMAFAVAALRARSPVTIRDCANVATSFPGFAALANRAGMDVVDA